ncbi:MAG: helix-turn-helix domain-containing protein [Bacteroidales bacterium]
MTRVELAAELGMSKQTLAHILSEKKVRGDKGASTLEKIARILKVPIGYFFDDDVQGHLESSPNRGNFAADHPRTLTVEGLLNQKMNTINTQIEILRKHEKVQDQLQQWIRRDTK